MNYEKIYKEITRLNFEDIVWFVFVILSILNIYGDYDEKEYLKTHENHYRDEANQIFTITLIVTFLIYLYFSLRNYQGYKEADPRQKELYSIKLLGSLFLVVGIACLLYFQTNQKSSNTSAPI